jgi:N4-(beta-N-acetylglucosaminyl)-L-asparaginase
MSQSRRAFIEAGAAMAASLVVPSAHARAEAVSAATLASGTRPIAVASLNGLRAVTKAYAMMQSGADPLDAAIAGVNIEELDPDDQSVGLGGLPNEEGVVQLDASVMHGPTNRAGAVGALEDIATPSLVAKAVMDYTDHIFLVGAGARKFALEMGFTPQNLLTDKSRQDWLRWKANLNPNDSWLDHTDDVKIAFTTGTINVCAVTAAGDIASCTSTSGMSWKIPGRIGDSPIIGAGQYCDNTVGAAGSTGRGEANIKVCGAFFIVEQMRHGVAPEQACLTCLERAVAMTERRLLDDRGRPRFDLQYFAVHKDGRYASATLYEGAHFAAADERGARVESAAYVFRGGERPKPKS